MGRIGISEKDPRRMERMLRVKSKELKVVLHRPVELAPFLRTIRTFILT
jgi:hypothetical protein